MNSIKKISSLILTAFFVFAVFAASAIVDKSKRNVSDFSGIKVSSGIDLYLTMGSTEEVVVEADDDIIDKIITEVEDGVLKIYVKDNIFWKWRSERKVHVTVKELNKLHCSAGSDVESENTIESEELSVKASSGSDVKLNVKTGKLFLDTSSGSDAKISGTSEVFNLEASSGSDIHASELKTKVCHVSVSSGSDASIYVTDELVAKASSGGDIRYSGNPSKKDIKESSGGDVYQK